MRKKYAMLTINSRQDIKTGEELIRRVLISYKFYFKNIFYGTKFIEKDPYFYDSTKSHQYDFFDKYYILKNTDKIGEFYLNNKKRRYHYNPEYAKHVELPDYVFCPILFKESSREEAIKRFKNRGERN